MSSIPKLNQKIMEECQLYVDNLIKPIHSLGQLENFAVHIAGVTGEKKPSHLEKAIVILREIPRWTEKIKHRGICLMQRPSLSRREELR